MSVTSKGGKRLNTVEGRCSIVETVGAKVLFMKRQKIFFALIVLVLILAACGGNDGGEDFEEPSRPVVVIGNGDASVIGQQLNICWPKGTGNVSCEPSFASGDPADALQVESTDTISINVNEADPPDAVLIESRALGDDGEPLLSLTLQSGNDIQFVASELPDGRNILDVTVFYYDLAESQAVVTNAFAVDVGTAIAAVTPEVTEETEEPETPTPTVEPTDEIEPTPTITPTVEPTETEEPETPTPPIEASPEETDEVDLTPEATEEETEEPEASSTSTEDVATEVGNDIPTPTQEIPNLTPTVEDETETPTRRPTNTPTIVPTTPPPTEPPTSIPTTIVPSPTVEVIPPTETSVSIITPTVSEDDVSAVVGTAPTVTIRVGQQNYDAIGLEYCRRGLNNEQICVERAIDTGSTVNRMVRVGRGRAAQLRIANGRPESVSYEVINLRTREVLESSERDGDNIILFSVNQPAGNYILSVVVDWEDTVGTYYFQLRIQE